MGQELLLELVSGCNLQCKMCAFQNGFTYKRMSVNMIEDIFKSIKIINDVSKCYTFTDLRMDG